MVLGVFRIFHKLRLISNGIVQGLSDEVGNTALDYATYNNDMEIVELLVQAGAVRNFI